MAQLLWIKFLISCAFRNLLRSPRRTMISLLAIAAATSAIIVFQSFIDGVQRTFRHNVVTSEFGHFQIFKHGFRDKSGDDPYGYQIENHDEIRKAIEEKFGPLAFYSRRQSFYGLLNYNDRSLGGRALAGDPVEERKFLTLNQVHEGKHLADGDTDSISVGYELARRLGIKPGDTVTLLVTTATGSINAADLTVIGTFKTGVTEMDAGMFYINNAVSERLLRVSGSPQIMIGFNTENEVPLIEPLKKLIKEKFPDLEVWHWRDLATFFDNTMGWLTKQMDVVKIIVMLVASISILNVFLMSLLERLGEFGTLRAMGTKRIEICMMIFVESIVQSAIGGILGLLVAIFAITVLLRNGIVMPPPPLMSIPFHAKLSVPWNSIPETLALVIGIAGGAGIFPAIKMARINIVEALGRNV